MRWYPTAAEAIAAFERKCKRLGIAPPLRYPPGVSGDFFLAPPLGERDSTVALRYHFTSIKL